MHDEKERVRIAEIRKKQKKITEGDKKKQDEHKQYKRLRKRRLCELKKNASKNDKRAVANIKAGQLHRRKNNKAKEHQVKKLQLQVKMFSNECRQLKRKLNSTPQNKYLDDSSNFSDTSSTFMTALSPAAKPCATNRMAVTKSPRDIVRQFHLD